MKVIKFIMNVRAKAPFKPIILLVFVISNFSILAQQQTYCKMPEVIPIAFSSSNTQGDFCLKTYIHVIRDENGNGGLTIYGRNVLQTTAQNGLSTLEMKDLSQGVYILTIENKIGIIHTERIINKRL